MNVFDYGNSHIITVAAMDGVDMNTCRTQVLASCALTNIETAETHEFYLGKECIGEYMYENSGIAQVPTSEVGIIFSKGDSSLWKRFADHENDIVQSGPWDVLRETFAGGYWFYEFTSHNQGDKIFAKDGTFIREVQDHEINGHLHILATSEGRIPMKEIAAQWGNRVDFRRPKRQTDVMRYLRGYLVKCGTQGVNMRPFGDIHSHSSVRKV